MTAAGSNEQHNDIVIIDELEPCPYLDGETARLPLRMPISPVTAEQVDRRLAEGHRRTGEYIYQTSCPNCRACEPIRLNCSEYRFSRNQRRVLSRGNRQFRQEIGELVADEQRVDLFNWHRRARGLATRETNIDFEEYQWGFVRSCFTSFEITYWLDDRLVCLGVVDRGRTSLSAVYTFFDPELKKESLGTYSLLKQIEFCQSRQLKFLYLGYYISASSHMNYKARFVPNERLIDGKWRRFDS